MRHNTPSNLDFALKNAVYSWREFSLDNHFNLGAKMPRLVRDMSGISGVCICQSKGYAGPTRMDADNNSSTDALSSLVSFMGSSPANTVRWLILRFAAQAYVGLCSINAAEYTYGRVGIPIGICTS